MSVLTQLVDELNRGSLRVVDLTQPLGPSTPVIDLPPMFAPSPGVSIDVISNYDEKGPAWYWNTIRMGEHTGTHFDAPIHWITGKDLPEQRVRHDSNVALHRARVRHRRHRRRVAQSRFSAHPRTARASGSRQHGRIPRGAWVLLRTGWSRRTDAASFINARDDGPHSPGFDARTSKVLAEDRDVLGVGVETIGTDAGQAGTFTPPFPNHATMHGAGKFGLASLCNLDQLPPTGAIVIAAPLKIVNGSGSPLRVLAIAPA